MNILDFPNECIEEDSDFKTVYSCGLTVFREFNKVKFSINSLSTSWMRIDDDFAERINFSNLNRNFLLQHLEKEIEIRNILDDGIAYIDIRRYAKAVKCFDEVLYYDPHYALALFGKSNAFFYQGHFVKSFRYYNRAVEYDNSLMDFHHQKMLMNRAVDERASFPKIKQNIYSGDECFGCGEYENALEFYDEALKDNSKFRDRILFKLLNKKASALVELKDYDNALDYFRESLNVSANDFAVFGEGLCQYELGLDISEDFKKWLDVDKKRQLKQAEILFELKFNKESLFICEMLLKNHFRQDKFYFELVGLKSSLMRE